jgi:hypothetical protein
VAPAFTRVEDDIQLRKVEALGCMPYVDAHVKRIGLSSWGDDCLHRHHWHAQLLMQGLVIPWLCSGHYGLDLNIK